MSEIEKPYETPSVEEIETDRPLDTPPGVS